MAFFCGVAEQGGEPTSSSREMRFYRCQSFLCVHVCVSGGEIFWKCFSASGVSLPLAQSIRGEDYFKLKFGDAVKETNLMKLKR